MVVGAFCRIGSSRRAGGRRGAAKHEAVLFGAIGDPRAPRGVVEREIIFRLGLDLFVNLRPIVLYDERLCPLKGKRAEDIDMVVVREDTEDVYTATGTREGAHPESASDPG